MPRDPFFKTRAAEIAANILTAQCQDLGLTNIDQYANGHVTAWLRGVQYEFSWDVTHQRVVLVHTYNPAEFQVVELAA